ncbi:MAG: putative metalloprotease CJM1_0395 family protein [Pseudomonadota bacterium]
MRGADGLTPDQQAQVQKLKAADQKVRQHEAAHQSAGAGLTGGATYQYVRGPDGRQYAVAGEVSINTSPAGTPEATLVKARQIRAAALAPADPSPQDRAVAAAASLMESQARAEISRKREEDQQSTQSHLSGMQDLQVNAKSRSADQATRAYGAAVQAVTEALGQAISTYA